MNANPWEGYGFELADIEVTRVKARIDAGIEDTDPHFRQMIVFGEGNITRLPDIRLLRVMRGERRLLKLPDRIALAGSFSRMATR